MAKDYQSGKRFKLGKSGDVLDNGVFKLPRRAMDNIFKAIGGENVSYSPAVDTSDRLLRVIFFGDKHPIRHYVQILIERDKEMLLSEIYKVLFNGGLNIVRNTVRPCPPRISIDLMRVTDGKGIRYRDVFFNTIDITFDIVGDNSDKVLERKLQNLNRRLNSLKLSHGNAFFVTKKSWAVLDSMRRD